MEGRGGMKGCRREERRIGEGSGRMKVRWRYRKGEMGKEAGGRRRVGEIGKAN